MAGEIPPVAWFCALKLELYASYVAAYDDLFAVYEWGSGGIVHLHALGWRFPASHCSHFICGQQETA